MKFKGAFFMKNGSFGGQDIEIYIYSKLRSLRGHFYEKL